MILPSCCPRSRRRPPDDSDVFTRVAIQAAIDERESLPHKVAILSPYAFEIRPRGFSEGVPNFRVQVERVAFRMHAVVVPDYLAVAIVAAVVAGARNNPVSLERLNERTRELGWDPDVELSTTAFRIEAVSRDLVGVDEGDIVEAAVDVGLRLSEFVLGQLIVTQPLGEMRPAVERAIGADDAGEVWLYDPSERDRATQVHRSLENWLIAKLRDAGVEPLDPAGEPFFDLAWRIDHVLYVCEVKSSTNNETHQLRLGLGQILQYRHQLRIRGDEVFASVLVEREPRDRRWLDLCDEQGVLLFWPDRWDDVAGHLLTPRPNR